MGDFGDVSLKGGRWASPHPPPPYFFLLAEEDKMLKCEQSPSVGRRPAKTWRVEETWVPALRSGPAARSRLPTSGVYTFKP